VQNIMERSLRERIVIRKVLAMKKVPKILLMLISVILGLTLLLFIGLNIFFRAPYKEFYSSSEKEFKIPGLNKGFTPQGLTLSASGSFLTCGYMKDGSASRIYVIGDDEHYVQLRKEDGTADTNHAGGLAVYGDYLYLTDEDYISIYRLRDVLNASSGALVTPISQFYLNMQAAFLYVENDKMYVGEFYREENYMTDEAHHMMTDAGDMHHAIMSVYALSKAAEYGIVSEVPEYVYSITGLAQGICIAGNGNIYLSTSYGTASSYIYGYNDPAQYAADGTFEIAGAEVPLYYMDSKHLEETVMLFPMSEELVFADGKIYVMGESASNKYIFGKFTGNNYVYSF
jgi:hypothetical protein